MVTSTRSYGGKSTSSFPTMGDKWMKHCVNASGRRSANTISVPRKNTAGGTAPGKTANVRGRTLIKEAQGPRFHISATLYKRNAAESSATERNVKLMSPAIRRSDGTGSAGDFWSKRAYGQRV